MSVSIKTKAMAFAAGLSCLIVAYAVAQPGQPGQPGQTIQPGQPDRPPTAPPRTGVGAVQPSQPVVRGEISEVDQFFASCLLAKNQAEIEISKLALERAQNPQVKQFAQQMIAEHQQLIPKLQQIAGVQFSADRSRGVQPANYEAAPGQPGQVAPPTQPTQPPTPGIIGRAPAQGGAVSQLIAIEQRIAEQSTKKLREKLEQKQGAEFDHCYLGSQIACHMQMSAALDVLKEQAPGQVRQIAQEAEPKVKQHLAMAEQLAEQLMEASTRQAGLERQPTETVPRVPR